MLSSNQTCNRAYALTHILTLSLAFRLFSTKCAKASRARRKQRQFNTLGRWPQFAESPESQKMSKSWVSMPNPKQLAHSIQPRGLETDCQAFRPKGAVQSWANKPLPPAFSHLLVDDIPQKALNCIRTRFARFFVANSLRCECFPAVFASWRSPSRR